MEVIFGTLASDPLRLIHHRASARGVQHRHHVTPPDPLPGQPITLAAWAGIDADVDHIVCYYTTDGGVPVGRLGQSDSAAVVPFHPAAAEWDTLSWGYRMRWEAVLPPQPEGTLLHYRIGAWRDGEGEQFADYPDVTAIGERASVAWFNGDDPAALPDPPLRFPDGAIFTLHIDTHQPPAWAREAIIYHLYVDRFYPGDGVPWRQTDDVRALMGGTLDGARQKLGYLSDLGITAVWLSPTWEAYSYHGYDVIDYYRTADHLGGDAALHRFIDAAHARGMHVLLDLPCNHLSDRSAIFQSALHDPTSPHRDWFTFLDSPPGYRAFFNVPSMPEINLAHPSARQWMIDIGRYWLTEFDADGYRLDYALGPGPDFWTTFTAACRDAKPDSVFLGEVIDSPQVQQKYIGRLDGCLDFYTNECLRKHYGWRTMDLPTFNRALSRHQAHFPAEFLLPAFLDNHDMNRFLHIAGGNKEALRAAFARLMTLPNTPILYYGTEVGMTHTMSAGDAGLDVSRGAMLWGAEQDTRLLEDFVALMTARRDTRKG